MLCGRSRPTSNLRCDLKDFFPFRWIEVALNTRKTGHWWRGEGERYKASAPSAFGLSVRWLFRSTDVKQGFFTFFTYSGQRPKIHPSATVLPLYTDTYFFFFQLYQCFLISGHQGTTVSQSQLQDVLIKTGEKVLDIKTLKMFKIRTWYRTEAISREEWTNMVLDRNSVCTMIHLQVNPSHGLGESIAFIRKKENVHLA